MKLLFLGIGFAAGLAAGIIVSWLKSKKANKKNKKYERGIKEISQIAESLLGKK